MMPIARSYILALAAAVLLYSPTIHADEEAPAPPSEEVLIEAQSLLSEANAHYAAERYDEARVSYQAAYDLTKAPGFLYNIAQSHRLAGQCRAAIEFYEKFLSLDTKTELRPKVEGFVAEMWTCLDEEKKAKEDKRAKAAAKNAKKDQDTAFSSNSKDTTPLQAERRSRLPLVGLALTGTGVLALGTGVYFGLSARSTSQDIESYAGPWGAAQESKEEEAQRFERFAIILGIGGTAAIAGGIATYLLTRSDEGQSIALTPSPGGAMLSYSSSL